MTFEEKLDLLPKMYDLLLDMNDRLTKLEDKQLSDIDLTKKKNVANFLGVTTKTVENMCKDGRLKQGVHFNRDIGKIVFVESAIKDIKGVA